MTKENIIEMAYKVDSDDVYTSFISTFTDDYNMLIVSIITAWFLNSNKDVSQVIMNFVDKRMRPNPVSFILHYNKEDSDYAIESVFENITEKNFHNLIRIIKSTTTLQNGIKNAYLNYYNSARHKCVYPHEAFAIIFGHNTNFPNTDCKGTFFRYNLLFYWFTYKFGIWNDVDTSRAILPCNDRIFENAKKYGVTKTKLKSTITGAVKLTNIARNWFGDNDFWKMYEFLNFYRHD